MANYNVMAKKEIRDVVRTNNKHLRNIAIGNASVRFLNSDAIRHFRNESMKALDELDRRGATFEDRQLRQSAMASYMKAMAAFERHVAAQQFFDDNPTK